MIKPQEAINYPNAVKNLQAAVDVMVVELAEKDEQIEHLNGMLLDLRTVNEGLQAEIKRLYEERGL